MQKQMDIPQLRFPEFTEPWVTSKLGEVVTNKSGKYNPEKKTESVKCIELEHLASETSQLLGFIDGKNTGSIKNKFSKGDVLFGKLRPYLKKYLLAPFAGVCSSEIWVLKGVTVSNEFLFRIVQTNTFIDLANQSSGSKMPRADWSVIENGLFSFPTLAEQTRIASFLTAVDEKLQALKKKKALLEQYKKGVMQRLFCLNPNSPDLHEEHDFEKGKQQEKSSPRQLRFKDDKGKAFPKWERKRLGEVCEIVGGGTPETNKEEYWNGAINWFTPTEIKSYYVSKSIRTITELGLQKSSAKKLPVGTILLTTRATIGEASIALEECTTNQGFQSLIAKEGNNNIYIFNWIKENKNELTSRANGSTFPEISKSEIEKIEIPIPSLPEQTRIANFLSAIDEKINAQAQFIASLEKWKTGLLQKMFV